MLLTLTLTLTHVNINRTMFTNEEDGEDELSGDSIQLNIQEACQESFLRSAARYQMTCRLLDINPRQQQWKISANAGFFLS